MILVLKLDKSKDVNDEHPQNMFPTYVKLEVSKLYKSKELNEEQS